MAWVLALVIFHEPEYARRMTSEMRESTFWVLTALGQGRRHGYALMEDVRQLSERRVDIKVATLYATLERLGQEGLIVADGDEITGGRLRRYFRLTDAGLERLGVEVHRMEAASAQARAILGSRRTFGSSVVTP